MHSSTDLRPARDRKRRRVAAITDVLRRGDPCGEQAGWGLSPSPLSSYIAGMTAMSCSLPSMPLISAVKLAFPEAISTAYRDEPTINHP